MVVYIQLRIDIVNDLVDLVFIKFREGRRNINAEKTLALPKVTQAVMCLADFGEGPRHLAHLVMFVAERIETNPHIEKEVRILL